MMHTIVVIFTSVLLFLLRLCSVRLIVLSFLTYFMMQTLDASLGRIVLYIVHSTTALVDSSGMVYSIML